MGGYLLYGSLALFALFWLFVQLMKWVWAPIRLRGRMTSTACPKWVAASDAELTPEQRDVLGRVAAALREHGFDPPVTYRNAGLVAGVAGVQMIAVRPATGDVAVAISAEAKQMRTNALALRTDFPDGVRVSTGGSRNIGFAPRNPTDDAANFSWVRDVPTLLEAHRRRLARAGRTEGQRVVPKVESIETFLRTSWDREHAWWVTCGYRYLDAAAGVYRPTWKGAFLSAWKLTQPVKRWRIRLRDRRARQEWNRLGMDGWQPPAAAPLEAIPIPAEEDADPAGSPLRYETALAEGEIWHERGRDGVTVRCGGPTAGRILLRNWGKLLSSAFFAAILCFTCYGLWQQWQMFSVLPSNFRWQLMRDTLRTHGLYALLWIALLTWDLGRIARAVRRARGTITVVANPSGLQFENVPGRLRSGHLGRDDVHALRVVLDQVGLSGKQYRLEAMPTDASDRGLTLMRSRSAAPLNEARQLLLVAMGMTIELEPATVGAA